VRVGICAWADEALIESGAFYPKKSMTADARLRHYARFFDTVEVNSSYYAIPAARNVLRWTERTPPGFVFHVKAYAPMTGHHVRPETLPDDVQALLPSRAARTPRGEVPALALPPGAMDALFRHLRGALGPLQDAGKLGYVLFQFAPWVRFDGAWVEYIASLPARLPGLRPAVEFRHRSWLPEHAADALTLLRAAGVANVVVDGPVGAGSMPRVAEVTAPLAVFRLHGRNAEGWARQLRGEEPAVREKYDYLYTEAELRELLAEIEEAADAADEVHVSFNNNNRDYPVRNARMLKRLLGEVDVPDSLPGDLFA
jgi:uncharacterized protein YecE (DUF72 family)